MDYTIELHAQVQRLLLKELGWLVKLFKLICELCGEGAELDATCGVSHYSCLGQASRSTCATFVRSGEGVRRARDLAAGPLLRGVSL